MGICWSSPQNLLDGIADGDEDDYNRTYLEDRILGEGEFGVVRLVRNVKTDTDWACKVLRKGAMFKDNVLYAPIQPAILRGEVEILRTLRKKSFCLQLNAVYEGPARLYIVTEQCLGGDLTEWAAAQERDFTVETVARISKELMTAVDHCYEHKILHRDIKPANLMFVSKDMSSSIRVIDFGSGCMDKPNPPGTKTAAEYINGNQSHTTYAGTGFFMAPEVFHEPYTIMVDVWSAAVSLYVLVAGYPSQDLQLAFNLLHKGTRDLRELPGHSSCTSLPDSYFDFLNVALTYHYRSRPTAAALLLHKFLEATPDAPSRKQPVSGSVKRHSVFLDFQKYERSLTTLLATMLSKDELKILVGDDDSDKAGKAQLSVIPCKDLIAKATQLQTIIADTITQQLPNSAIYDNFAYHTVMLRQFVGDGQSASNKLDTMSTRSVSQRWGRLSAKFKNVNNSVHGTTVFAPTPKEELVI